MFLPEHNRRWRWVELARYDAERDGVIRLQHDRVPVMVEWGAAVEQFRARYHNRGLYTSVFHYDDVDPTQATRLGSLYFDLDNAADPVVAQREADRLVTYLGAEIPLDAICIYFTGQKGFHVEVEAVALGIGPTNDLPSVFRFIAGKLAEHLQLTTLDFAVYDLRRMWRLPNSQHQKTGLYKVELDLDRLRSTMGDIEQYAHEPHFDIDKSSSPPRFVLAANVWYRQWVYEHEEQSLTVHDRLERFARQGTNLVSHLDDGNLVFDPLSLFRHCPAVLRHWATAETTHELAHDARLFLCSLLSYTPEAEWYLHQILRNCDDYLEEKSQAHIDDWKERRRRGIGGRPFSCAVANAKGVGCGNCVLEPREKYEKVGDKFVRTGELAQPSPIRFAYRRPKDH